MAVGTITKVVTSFAKSKKGRSFIKKIVIIVVIILIVIIGTFFTICLAITNACNDIFYWIFGGIFGDVSLDAGPEYTEEFTILTEMKESFANIDTAVQTINERIGIDPAQGETHEAEETSEDVPEDESDDEIEPETAEAEEGQDQEEEEPEPEPEPEEESEIIEPETSVVLENVIDPYWVKAVYYAIYCDNVINGDAAFFSSFAECFVLKTEGENNKIIETPQDDETALFAALETFLNIEITAEMRNRASSAYAQIEYINY